MAHGDLQEYADKRLAGRTGKAGTPHVHHVHANCTLVNLSLPHVLVPGASPWEGKVDACDPGIWLVRTWQIQATQDDQEANLTSLARDVIGRIGTPGRGYLGIEITATTLANTGAGGGRGQPVWEIDAGQSLAVVAHAVTCRLLGPAGSVILGADDAPIVTAAGDQMDAMIAVGIERVESFAGARRAVRSIYRRALANVVASIEVPPGSRRVQIFQSGGGAASVQWQQGLDFVAPGGIRTDYAIPFIAGARKTEPEEIISGCTHIFSDIDPLVARDYVAVFEVEP